MNSKEKKKKLEDIIEKLEKSSKSSDNWKKIIEENKEEFLRLKSLIRSKQNELKDLVIKKQVGAISKVEFEKELDFLQEELTNLEFKIYNLRLKDVSKRNL